MISIKKFTFNPFQENTYVVYNDKNNCIIIDPGCYEKQEFDLIDQFIQDKEFTIKDIIITHSHIDHVLGAHFFTNKYNLLPIHHEIDAETLKSIPSYAHVYGFNFTEFNSSKKYLSHNEIYYLDDDKFEIKFTPGHAPGHISLINHEEKAIFSGDVIFQNSIGRTDLPGGDFDVLEQTILNEIYSLPDDYKIFSGHGNKTSVGHEKINNPFVKIL